MTKKKIDKVLDAALQLQKELNKLRTKDSMREPIAMVGVLTTKLAVEVLAWELDPAKVVKASKTLTNAIAAIRALLPCGGDNFSDDRTSFRLIATPSASL